MPDVFLSYSREDKARAEAVAQALTNAGYDVFWDNEIPPGSTWADYLQSKITAAKALVVLWTSTSTQSQWVREEARIGRDAKKLVPIILDGTAPPFGFGEVQAVDLGAWRGEPNHPEWQRFLNGLTYVVQQSGGAAPTPTGAQRAVKMPAAPGGQGAGPAAELAKSTGVPKWAIYGGVGFLALVGIGAIVQETNTPAGPGVAPGPGQAPIVSNATIGPRAQAAQQRALDAQRQARAAAVEARSNASLGMQAAQAAQAGQPGFGSTENLGNTIVGDIAGLSAGRAAPVSAQFSAGMQFSGLMQVLSDTSYTLAGAAQMRGGANFAGRWRYEGENGKFTASGAVPGKYSLEAVGSSNGREESGLAVIQYPSGERYEGEYRAVGEPPDATVFRNGHGVHFAADGSVINAGRFDNDRFVGAE